ncbi:hypothetical protein ACFL5O_08220 [Myxococcota bacterium]
MSPSNTVDVDVALAEAARSTVLASPPRAYAAMNARLHHQRGVAVDTNAYCPRDWKRLPHIWRLSA